MRGMRILGEPFTFGVDDAEEFLQSAGLRCLEAVTSDLYLPDKDDPVYAVYQFCVAGRATEQVDESPLTFQAARFDARQGCGDRAHFTHERARERQGRRHAQRRRCRRRTSPMHPRQPR